MKLLKASCFTPLTISIILCLTFNISKSSDNFNYQNGKFHFLPGSGMGLLVAIAVPLDTPIKTTYLAYNFEANYLLPGNESSYEYPPLIQKRIDRQLIYHALEAKMETNGYPGRACLLRTICEAAAFSIQHSNGVLGDILHIIFTPSTSINTDLLSDYQSAEEQGRKENNCSNYDKNCTVSFLELVSFIGKSA